MKDMLLARLKDPQDRAAIMTVGSLMTSAFFGVIKLAFGVYLPSAWFIINAAYYLLLCVARWHAVAQYAQCDAIDEPSVRYNRELAIYRRSGVFISLLGVSYLFVCLWMLNHGDATIYTGNMVFFVALVGFSKTGAAIHGLITTRHMRNPIVSALKAINIADVLVSIVVTQCTLLAMQGVEGATRYSAMAGMAVCAFIIVEGIYMVRKRKALPTQPDACTHCVRDIENRTDIITSTKENAT